jgi:hypothetical protein
MLIVYIASGAFVLGGGLVFFSNLASQRSRSRYY